MKTAILLSLAFFLAACTSIGRYTGDEYYYTGADGTRYSCREPKPYPGGNCKRELDWAAQGLN